jgi:hypothetical protein
VPIALKTVTVPGSTVTKRATTSAKTEETTEKGALGKSNVTASGAILDFAENVKKTATARVADSATIKASAADQIHVLSTDRSLSIYLFTNAEDYFEDSPLPNLRIVL